MDINLNHPKTGGIQMFGGNMGDKWELYKDALTPKARTIPDK